MIDILTENRSPVKEIRRRAPPRLVGGRRPGRAAADSARRGEPSRPGSLRFQAEKIEAVEAVEIAVESHEPQSARLGEGGQIGRPSNGGEPGCPPGPNAPASPATLR